ncbi:MAG TPA: hypothetical protein VFJ30_12930 [Phycisphaerae bacterium]|nr:hypothetical protein [Phycisphaerae bacterium]
MKIRHVAFAFLVVIAVSWTLGYQSCMADPTTPLHQQQSFNASIQRFGSTVAFGLWFLVGLWVLLVVAWVLAGIRLGKDWRPQPEQHQ